MYDKLRKNWNEVWKALKDSDQRRYLSPAVYAQYQISLLLMHHYIRGDMIDLGCGDMPFKRLLVNQVSLYHSMDLWPCSDEVTYIGDISDMKMVPSERYDSAICMEVLEHVPNPFRAVREIYRILRPGGVAILSVPHLSRLHDEPYDYFRFTVYGLRQVLQDAGFLVINIYTRGGLFSFLGHQFSTLLLSALWSIPGVRQVAWILNRWLITWLCYNIDRLCDPSGLFALGYVAVVQKPDGYAGLVA